MIKKGVCENLYDKRLSFFLALIFVFLFLTVFAPDLAPNDAYKVNMPEAFLPPGGRYPLGTDDLGRCIFSRILCGGKTTVFSALAVVMAAAVTGMAVGISSGYLGGWTDLFFSRITLIFQAFPSFILAVAIAGILGNGLRNCILSIVIVSWTKYARLSRSLTLSVSKSDYVKAVKVCGGRNRDIMFRHILPNIASPLIVTASLDISNVILYMSGLSFLGLGAEKPSAEWGVMMNEARAYLQLYPGMLFYPGIALLMCVILFNLFGDCVRDCMDVGKQVSKGKIAG